MTLDIQAGIARVRARRSTGDASVDQLLMAMATCRKFIGTSQIQAMQEACRGEEGEWFRAKFLELAQAFETMPRTYSQDGLGDAAIVHWHFFHGGSDWWITERDMEVPQFQAFGMACLNGDVQNAECGYIDVVELIRASVQFDLHWTPCTLGQVRETLEQRNG